MCEMKKMKFTSVEELKQILEKLDIAEVRPALTLDANGNTISIDNAKVIWNLSKNRAEGFFSKKYTLVQHYDAFIELTEILKDTQQFIGWVYDFGGRVSVNVCLTDESYVIIAPDNSKINFGIHATNSIDGTSAFTISLFGFRDICQNGMIFGKKIFSKSYQLHRGNMFTKIYRYAFNEILKLINPMKNVIEIAFSDTITRSETEIQLKKYGIGNTTLKKLRFEPLTNRWEVYCELTRYITHELDNRKEQTKNKYYEIAEKVLLNPFERVR